MKKLLVALLASVSMMAHAVFFSGNDLLSEIQSDSSVKRMVALGFVMGVHDAMEGEYICSGSNVTAGQLRDVVQQGLQNNPKDRNLSASLLVMVYLGEAFPCSKKGRSS